MSIHRSNTILWALLALLLNLTVIGIAAGATPASDFNQYRGQQVVAIEFQGLKHTKSYVAAREVESAVGKPLDPGLVAMDIVRLENRGIFGSVDAQVTPTDGGVTLVFECSELPWIIPHPSLKYTEENGFSIGAGVSSPNMFGRAITFAVNALFGGTTTYGGQFQNPWIAGNHVSGGIQLAHDERTNVLLAFEETSDLIKLSGGSYLDRPGRLAANAGYYSVQSDVDSITLNPDNKDRMYFGNIVLGFDSRDSWLSPRRGWKNQFISVSYAGGDADFWTFQLDVNRYQPLGKQQIFAFGPLLSLQTGIVDEDIPQYFQYFLGGANTIRGYDLTELGKELFGKNQFLFNLEYRWNFYPMRGFQVLAWKVKAGLQLAGFADAGVAWSESRDFTLDHTRLGFGAGLRLLLPVVEMIRLDVGVSQFGDVKFNFGVRSIFFGRRQRVR